MHWLPIRLARGFALRSIGHDVSLDQPAMRTILAGTLATLLWYLGQAVLLEYWFGWLIAILWIVALFLAAQIDLLLHDRLNRTFRRARTYLALRRDADLQVNIVEEIDRLVRHALELEDALNAVRRNVSSLSAPSAEA
jgi:hypothetical protein